MAKKNFRPFILNIPANTAVPLNMRGRYFRIYAASENLVINGLDVTQSELMDASAGIAPGVELGPFDPEFQTLNISTLSGAAGTATIWISDVGTNVATVAGTVNIIDNTSPRFVAVSGKGYLSKVSVAGVAAKLSIKQLRNPVGSGKNLIVTGLNASINGAAPQYLYAALVTTAADLTNADHIAPRLSPSGNPPASVAVVSSDTLGAIATLSFMEEIIQVNVISSIDMDEYAVCIVPGDALQIWCPAFNTSISGILAWDEWQTTQL